MASQLTSPTIRRLAWVTTRTVRGLDLDEPSALAALTATGLDVEVVDWDDPQVDWSSYDRAVLRSTWDYTERLDEFLRWVDFVATRTDLRNPATMVRWSTDKHYLAELEAAELPVIPTVFVEPGQQPRFPWGGVVVKPAVGAGGRNVAIYSNAEHALAAAHVARLHANGSSVLVQPLVRSVEIDGEWCLVFLAGRFSHAVNKRVALTPGRPMELFTPETIVPGLPEEAQLSVAEAVIAWVTERFGVPTYARVDLVRDDHGSVCVLEVELVEPALFLFESEASALKRMVVALAGR